MALISVAEAAAKYGLSVRWIRELLKQGVVQGQRFGRTWAVDETSLEAYEKSPRKRGPKARAP